jgi:uncharacterized protein (UPF0335 family)
MAKKPAEKNAKTNDIATKAKSFLDRIENLDAEKEELKRAFMDQCKGLNEDVKEIYGEAKESGIAVKALKGVVKQRKMLKKMDAIDANFDIDEQAQFEALAIAFAGTPFGEHAKARASAGSARGPSEQTAMNSGQDLVDQLAN